MLMVMVDGEGYDNNDDYDGDDGEDDDDDVEEEGDDVDVEEEDDDVEKDVEEEDRSQDWEAHIVRACAVEMHTDISQEPFCAEIYRENAGCPGYHLDWTPGLNIYRKNPSVWPHCLGKYTGTPVILTTLGLGWMSGFDLQHLCQPKLGDNQKT